MPTLSKAKKQTQTILRWLGISLFIIFLFLLGARFLAFIKDVFTPPPPPQASFGKLPGVYFPNQQKENIIYSLNTLSGFLPNFSDRAKVYKISTNPPTLLALNKTREKAFKVGFTANETRIAGDVYQWTNRESPLQEKLTINIFSSDFTLSSAYLTASDLQTLGSSEEKNNAIEIAQSFLMQMSLFTDDLDSQKTKATSYSIEKSALIPTSKFSDAKIVRVDFFQKDLEKMPIYYEKGAGSTINFLVGKENNELEVVDARYFHKNISEDFSTYAIKSASLAFSELKDGKGYIASKDPHIVEVTIKKVTLGYYAGEMQQEFLMPIVIFEGDNDFVAYVSAVKDEWISN